MTTGGTRKTRALRRRQANLSALDCEKLVGIIFAKVNRTTHKGDRWDGNTGEVTPYGVTFLLRAMGPIAPSDVFLDVGSGLGNIMCQMLLPTNVSKAWKKSLQCWRREGWQLSMHSKKG